MRSASGPDGEEPTLQADHVGLLSKIDIFARIDPVALAKLAAQLRPLNVADGEEVCRFGEPGDCLYIVTRGSFSVLAPAEGSGREVQVATCVPGEYFGEMAPLTREVRSATVRAEGSGQLLRLDRAHLHSLIKQQPEVAIAIIGTLSRRLRDTTRSAAEGRALLQETLDRELAGLSAERRSQILDASLLESVSPHALEALFGDVAAEVGDALEAVAAQLGESRSVVLTCLRESFELKAGRDEFGGASKAVALRLADATCWEDALAILARRGDRDTYLAVLDRALREVPSLRPDQAGRWIGAVTEDEASRSGELALAKSWDLESRGDAASATRVLRKALGVAMLGNDPSLGSRLTHELARLTAARGTSTLMGWRHSLQPGAWMRHPPRAQGALLVAASLLAIAGITAASASPQVAFLLLLGATVVMWMAELVEGYVMGLGLLVVLVLLGVTKPASALAGFGSMDWIFVVAVFGIAAAVARSGLLFRVGLLLMRRMPRALFWQAGLLLLTGNLLAPLLPNNVARSTLTAPLAVAVADASRLKDREPAAAVLGLAAWIGAGAMPFLFLNASQFCLLAWGLLPEQSRQRFDWVGWFIAAAPLGLFIGLGSLVALFVVLRPRRSAGIQRDGIGAQLAILGPIGRREAAMIVVLAGTLLGWVLGGRIGVDFGTVAILGLIASVATGNFDRKAVQELDWSFLLLYGTALCIAGVGGSLGLSEVVGGTLGGLILRSGSNPVVFLLIIAVSNILIRFVMRASQSVLLLSLALIPTAPILGVDPWLIVVTIIATTFLWFPPSQTGAYLAALGASEGRLYSAGQSARMSFAFMGVVLAGIVASAPYWHVLGLL